MARAMTSGQIYPRTMTAENFRDALAKIGITPYRAAKLLGISARTAQRYATGQQPVSLTVSILLDKIAADYPRRRP